MWTYNYTDELYHHGILGQKWGERRYQNFDGTYTKAGLERYNKSKDIYEKRKAKYNELKKTNPSKYEKQYAKAKVKEAKQRMNKDYKHLRNDKMADKGKVRYARGERIRNNAAAAKFVHSVAGVALAGAVYGKQMGIIDDKVATGLALSAVAMEGASIAKRLIDEIPNRELREYYRHSSKNY